MTPQNPRPRLRSGRLASPGSAGTMPATPLASSHALSRTPRPGPAPLNANGGRGSGTPRVSTCVSGRW